jgi:hypothetical protein
MPRRDLISKLEEQATERIADYDAIFLADVFAAYGKLGFLPGDVLFSALERQVSQRISEFSTKSISSMLWGYANLDSRPGERGGVPGLVGLLETQVTYDVLPDAWKCMGAFAETCEYI